MVARAVVGTVVEMVGTEAAVALVVVRAAVKEAVGQEAAAKVVARARHQRQFRRAGSATRLQEPWSGRAGRA